MSLAVKLFQNIFKKLISGTNKPVEKPHQTLRARCIYTEQQICLSSEGFFTPCCWFDDDEIKPQKWVNTFFYDHLNLRNFDDIEDIFKSKEWVRFFRMLKENPEDAPPICNLMCGSSLIAEQLLKISELPGGTKVMTRIRH